MILSLVLLSACSGSGSESPAPSSAPPDPATTAPEAAAEAAAPPADPRLEEWFPPELRAQMQAEKARFDSIRTAEDFAASLAGAAALGTALSDVVQVRYEANPEGMLELGWLWPHLPGMQEGYFAEGTAVQVFPAAQPWAERAAQTPGTVDDDFLAFMAMGYDNPTAVGWSSWTVRNWDYGGCSSFGSGQHEQILKRADALLAAGSPFADRVQQVRTSVLGDIFNETSTFPYCNIETLQPTPPEQLQAEAQRILDGVKLSEEERAALQARMQKGFPVEAIGG